MKLLNKYPGSKTNSGIIQFLCNNTPLHTRYFELFAGTANYFFNKRPAVQNIIADLNPDVITALHHKIGRLQPGTELHHASAFIMLNSYQFTREDFIYLDPPYPASSRRN